MGQLDRCEQFDGLAPAAPIAGPKGARGHIWPAVNHKKEWCQLRSRLSPG
jgi:hypothetical protein